MKEPFYFADEKELFAKIVEMSDELTRSVKVARPDGGVPSKKRKTEGDDSAGNTDAGRGPVLPVSN
jgi:hypothetical protein